MAHIQTPDYIKAVVRPNGSKAPKGRRVWSIELDTVWLPFFTATNANGDTSIAHDALGAPLRLAYNADGTVKFGKTGKPVIKVAKDLQDQIRLARENYIAGLLDFAHKVLTIAPDAYKAEVEANAEAGKPIIARDRQALDKAMEAEAEAIAGAIAKAEAKAKAKSKAKKDAVGVAS